MKNIPNISFAKRNYINQFIFQYDLVVNGFEFEVLKQDIFRIRVLIFFDLQRAFNTSVCVMKSFGVFTPPNATLVDNIKNTKIYHNFVVC